MDELVKGNVMVCWVELGEGWDGDYDPDDPDDEELLRFDVLVKEGLNDDTTTQWSEVESYCTAVPVTATPEERARGLKLIMDEVYDAIQADAGIKHICGSLSWMTIQTLRTDHPVIDRSIFGPNLAV